MTIASVGNSPDCGSGSLACAPGGPSLGTLVTAREPAPLFWEQYAGNGPSEPVCGHSRTHGVISGETACCGGGTFAIRAAGDQHPCGMVRGRTAPWWWVPHGGELGDFTVTYRPARVSSTVRSGATANALVDQSLDAVQTGPTFHVGARDSRPSERIAQVSISEVGTAQVGAR